MAEIIAPTDYHGTYSQYDHYPQDGFFSSIRSLLSPGSSTAYSGGYAKEDQYAMQAEGPKIIDWTYKTKNFNDRIFFVVLHHTATPDLKETVEAFNENNTSSHYVIDKDGSIYRLVKESKRAWHAGESAFDGRSDLNDTSIGIEIVNTGDQEFSDAQILGAAELTKYLMDEYNIKQHRVVGHADIAPDRKSDPSGYFDWEKFYERVGIFQGLFKSGLTPQEQHKVLLEYGSRSENQVAKLQRDLKTIGYEIKEDGLYGEKTSEVVQAFNRHFAPEVFIKEVIGDSEIIHNPENQRWYKVSEERLVFLLDQLKKT